MAVDITYNVPFLPQFYPCVLYVNADRNWERIIAMKTKRSEFFRGYTKYVLRDVIYRVFELMYERFFNTSEYKLPYKLGTLCFVEEEYERLKDIPQKALINKKIRIHGDLYNARCQYKALWIILNRTRTGILFKPTKKLLKDTVFRIMQKKDIILYDYGETVHNISKRYKPSEKTKRLQEYIRLRYNSRHPGNNRIVWDPRVTRSKVRKIMLEELYG